ncbi:hypothetical protein AOLI_G00100530 [Acnodon oligacanthus]
MHLKTSPRGTLQFKALQTQELNPQIRNNMPPPERQLLCEVASPIRTADSFLAQASCRQPLESSSPLCFKRTPSRTRKTASGQCSVVSSLAASSPLTTVLQRD